MDGGMDLIPVTENIYRTLKKFGTSSSILKLLNKILILFEIFCTNKDIHLKQKILILHWLQLFSEMKYIYK